MSVEAMAAQAYELEAQVLAARVVERRSWVLLAQGLSDFFHAKAWQALGYEKLVDWLGSPEVAIGRRTAYRLIQAWDWSVVNEIGSGTLELLDLSKLLTVIPAVKAGANLEEALSDAQSLSRADLIERYARPTDGAQEAAQKATEVCERCGREVLPA